MSSKKHQIILIRGPDIADGYGDYGYEGVQFIESVGEWDEVTTEELAILKARQSWYGFRVVERNPLPHHDRGENLRTPRDYINEYYQEEEKRKKANEERQVKKKAKSLETKKKQLEKLKKELGEE